MAKQIALQQGPPPILFLRTSLTPNYSKAKMEALLSQEGTSKHPSGWITLHDKLVLPEKQAMSIIIQIHDSLHIGPHTLLNFPSPLFPVTSPTYHSGSPSSLPNLCQDLSSRRTQAVTRNSPVEGTPAGTGLADRLYSRAWTSDLPVYAGLC